MVGVLYYIIYIILYYIICDGRCIILYYTYIILYYIICDGWCIILHIYIIIESVDSISRDERDVPLTQYITNA